MSIRRSLIDDGFGLGIGVRAVGSFLPRSGAIAVQMALAVSLQGFAQTPPPAQTFEVGSIKRAPHCSPPRTVSFPPGRVVIPCITAINLIRLAYGTNGADSNPRIEIIGAPAWLGTETFNVAAKAPDNANLSVMHGPMLRALLEDTFALRTHVEARVQSVYILTVANSGLKMPRTKEGSCRVTDQAPEPTNLQSPPVPPCGSSSVRVIDGNLVVDAHGLTVASLVSSRMFGRFDRALVDRTGLTGMFDLHLEVAPNLPAAVISEKDSAVAAPSGPDIFTALREQLGLKIERGDAPVNALVIDAVKEPTDN